jgi:hypothetical protein
MRPFIFIPVLALGLAVAGSHVSFAQQQQQQSSDPYAPPPPPPKPPSTQPDKSCSGQATRGSTGPWKGTSTCPPPAQKDDTPSIAPTTDSKKSTADDNPFPEDVSKKAAGAAQDGTPSNAPATDSSQQAPKKSTADDNPFPEDVSKKAAEAAKAKDAEDAKPSTPVDPNAGESSSSDRTKGMDLEGEGDSRIANGAGGTVLDPQLAEHDVQVGQFYINQEDYKGAYQRFKEATQVDPANSDAIFYLAETARRLNHRDEAVQNYQVYLDALPNGPKAKEARKALQELKTSAKR